MADELKGKKIAFLATDMVEQAELTGPWEALQGCTPTTRTGSSSWYDDGRSTVTTCVVPSPATVATWSPPGRT